MQGIQENHHPVTGEIIIIITVFQYTILFYIPQIGVQVHMPSKHFIQVYVSYSSIHRHHTFQKGKIVEKQHLEVKFVCQQLVSGGSKSIPVQLPKIYAMAALPLTVLVHVRGGSRISSKGANVSLGPPLGSPFWAGGTPCLHLMTLKYFPNEKCVRYWGGSQISS